MESYARKVRKITSQFKALESTDMLKDFDFEAEKMVLVQKMNVRRDSTRINSGVMRPQKTILSPNYNFYKPTIDPKCVRAGSKKTETKSKPRPSNAPSTYTDNKNNSRPGKIINSGHSSKPSRDIAFDSIKNKVFAETINNDNQTHFDISQLKSEQMSLCTEKETIKTNKDISNRNASVFATNRDSQHNNPYREEISSITKNLELNMTNPTSINGKYVPLTPTKARDFNNNKKIEVNIFNNKRRKDIE